MAKVSVLPCASTFRILGSQFRKLLGVSINLCSELFDVVSGFLECSGDGLISIGVHGVSGSFVLLQNVRTPYFHFQII